MPGRDGIFKEAEQNKVEDRTDTHTHAHAHTTHTHSREREEKESCPSTHASPEGAPGPPSFRGPVLSSQAGPRELQGFGRYNL